MKKFLERARAWLTGHSGMAFYATVLLIAVLVSLNAVVYALTTQYNLYLYSPAKEAEPLSGNSELYFARAMQGGRRVRITFCDDETNVSKHSTGAFVYNTAMALAEKHPNFLEVRFVNVITGFDAEGNYVDLTEFTDGGSVPLTRTSVIFDCEGNHRVLVGGSGGYEDFFTLSASGTVYAYNGEEVLAAMVCWVTEREHKTVYFTQNHGETADIALNAALVCSGFYVKTVNLRKEAVPEDAALVIISNPISDFEVSAEGSGATAELDRLESYLERGGNLYVALDPLVKKLNNLEGYLEAKGFAFYEHTDGNGNVNRELVRDDAGGITTDGYGFVLTPADNSAAGSVFSLMDKYVEGRVLVHGTARLRLSGGAVPLLKSSASSVTAAAGRVTDTEGSYDVIGYNKIAYENGNEAEIVVIPNTYLTSTEAMANNSYTNKAFVISLMSVFFDGTSAPLGCNTLLYSSPVLENFTMGRARAYTAIILAIPALLAVAGTVIIIKRKNR